MEFSVSGFDNEACNKDLQTFYWSKKHRKERKSHESYNNLTSTEQPLQSSGGTVAGPRSLIHIKSIRL